MRRLALWLGVTVFLTGCSAQVQIGDPQNGPRCGASVDEVPVHGSVSGLLLMAQSVSTASLVPCVHPMPAGWTFRRLEATDRSARFWLTSDRYGETALRVDLTRDCRVEGTTKSSTDKPGTQRFDRIDARTGGHRGDRFYRYNGGCITLHFDLSGNPPADEAANVAGAVGVLSRDALRRYVHDYSDGRFELDPDPGTQR